MKRRQLLSCAVGAALALPLFSASAASARSSFKGDTLGDAKALSAFLRRSVGKTIDLEVTFAPPGRAKQFEPGGEPYTSLGGNTGPIFVVGGDSVNLENAGNERTWRELLNYDRARRRLRGTFTVTRGVKSGEDSGYIYDLRFRPARARNIKVNVVDQSGRTILQSSAFTVPGDSSLVPVKAYDALGLSVKTDIKKGTVTVGTPQSYNETPADATTFDIVYSSTTHRPNPEYGEQKLYEDFKPVRALLQNGEFFVSASLMQRRFPHLLSTNWSARSRTLTLKRSAVLGKLLDKLSEVG